MFMEISSIIHVRILEFFHKKISNRSIKRDTGCQHLNDFVISNSSLNELIVTCVFIIKKLSIQSEILSFLISSLKENYYSDFFSDLSFLFNINPWNNFLSACVYQSCVNNSLQKLTIT